jgi:hypothetical protein
VSKSGDGVRGPDKAAQIPVSLSRRKKGSFHLLGFDRPPGTPI